MANIKVIKGSQLPVVEDINKATFLAYEENTISLKSGRIDLKNMLPLFGVTGEKGQSETLAINQLTYTRDVKGINDGISDILGGETSADIPLSWQHGYYIGLDGVIKGDGMNELYKMSNPIPVKFAEKHIAVLQAGNLLAVSGWTNGVFNNALAIAGTDTDNPVEYPFTSPKGMTHVRLTCRKELANPTLTKTNVMIGGRLPAVEDKVADISDLCAGLDDAVFIESSEAWTDVSGISWQNGYYVELNGNVLGDGTNELYKLSAPVSVQNLGVYKAILQAGNLLAVSGWTNGVFNPNLAIVGTDTNNPAEYPFTNPSGVTHVRLTCRKELATPQLQKYNSSSEPTKINRIDRLEKEVGDLSSNINRLRYKGVIASLSDFVGSKNITGSGSFFGSGKLEFPTNIATEDLDFVAKIKVNTSGQFGLCRADTSGYGTALTINGDKAEIRRVSATVGTVTYSFTMPFSVVAGKTYIVRLFKKNKDIIFSVLTESCELYTNTAIYDSSHDFGRNWGHPTVFCINGSIEIQDVFVRNSVYDRPRILIVGDSLVEGWGVIDSLMKRYAALLQTALGYDNVIISGRGGETSTTLRQRFDLELSKYNTLDYVISAIGTNDSSLSTFTANQTAIASKIKAKLAEPIFVTITPRSGFPVTDMNTFVRNSGELFVDMNKAVNNGTETSWNPLFVNSDNVHPNIAGNEAMFKRILFDFYCFFSSLDINKIANN